jgi:hypothetical protein
MRGAFVRRAKDLTQRAQRKSGEHRESGRDPSAGLERRRRPPFANSLGAGKMTMLIASSETQRKATAHSQEWLCHDRKTLRRWSDQGASAATGAGFRRRLLHYVAEAYEELAELAAFFEFHIDHFESAGLSVGVADDG